MRFAATAFLKSGQKVALLSSTTFSPEGMRTESAIATLRARMAS